MEKTWKQTILANGAIEPDILEILRQASILCLARTAGEPDWKEFFHEKQGEKLLLCVMIFMNASVKKPKDGKLQAYALSWHYAPALQKTRKNGTDTKLRGGSGYSS